MGAAEGPELDELRPAYLASAPEVRYASSVRNLVVSVLLALAACSSPDAQPPRGDAGADVLAPPTTSVAKDISRGDGRYETESYVAVADDGAVVAVWTLSLASSIDLVYRISPDRGDTWGDVQSISLPDGLSSVDPSVAVGADGTFYFGMLGWHYGGSATVDAASVWVATAKRGAKSFGAPVKVSDPTTAEFYDHPKIVVTQKGTVALGYMRAASYSAQTSRAEVTYRSGAGWVQTPLTLESTKGYANFVSFCEGAGRLYATFNEFDAAGPHVSVRWSDDDGKTWSPSSTFASSTSAIADGDPTCVADGDDLWVTYGIAKTKATGADQLEAMKSLRVAHSGDRGVSFLAPQAEALDLSSSAVGLFPMLLREPSGALDVVHIAGATLTDPAARVVFTRSEDTVSFGAATLVDEPLTYQISRMGNDWLGDYLGATIRGGAMYVVYPRNDGGASRMWFRRMALP